MTTRSRPGPRRRSLILVTAAVLLGGPVVAPRASAAGDVDGGTRAQPRSAVADRGVARPSTARLTAITGQLRTRLAAAGAGAPRVRVRPEDGTASFLAAAQGHAVRASAAARRAAGRSVADGSTADGSTADGSSTGPSRPGERDARAFLQDFGGAFAVDDQAAQLTTVDAVPGAGGSVAVRFQQRHRGVPVLGGELVVTVDGAGDTSSANGRVAPQLDAVPTAAAVSAERAAGVAVAAAAAAAGVDASRLSAAVPQRWIFDPALLHAPGPAGRRLVWRTQVTSADATVRRFVLVDAALGTVALQFDENAQAKVRYVCDDANVRSWDESCRAPYVRREGDTPVALSDANLAYDYSGLTYDFYRRMFGRDSVDGRGMRLLSTVRYCTVDFQDTCPLQNAFWNGSQMLYGEGFAGADDVVGHELTHGITERTAGLFYYAEAGAIDESISDIFGELIDQTDHRGDDSPAARWKLGEDLPYGWIRDLKNPGTTALPVEYRQPDRTGSGYWYVGAEDNGGVHTNSGVGNKAASLLVDGGTFNGQSVGAIGVDRTARIFYEALTRLMTSATDYHALADILPQACVNLIGTASISSPVCTAVQRAVTATQMASTPAGGVPESPVCSPGQVRHDLLADDLEASTAWERVSDSGGMEWAYPQTENPYLYGPDFAYATSGRTSMWAEDSGWAGEATIRMRAPVTLPATGTAYLRFAHAWQFAGGGGGQLVYSTDAGAHWDDASTLPAVNGFTSESLAGLGDGPGWAGTSHGYTTSRFDLTTLAGAHVRFGFRAAGTDNREGEPGWFVDDVSIYTCAADLPAPTPSVTVDDVRSGEGPGAQAVFTLTRDQTTGTASVTVATTGGTAVAGADYTAVPPTAVSFVDGQATRTVAVDVLDDSSPEIPETLTLTLSNPVGMVLGDPTGVGLIMDEDPGVPTTVSVADAWVREGDAGIRNAGFVVARFGDTSGTTTARVSTLPASGTSADFVPLAPTTVTFAPGVISRTVWVGVRGDTRHEPNESFALVLGAVTGGYAVDDAAKGTILDDDGGLVVPARSTFAATDVVLAEPDTGTATATFTVVRSGDVSAAGSVVVGTADGSARAGADYVAVPATRLAFAAGQRTRTVAVSVVGDTIPEFQERLRLRLSAPVGGMIGDGLADAVLVDDDPGTPASLSIADAVVLERHPAATLVTVHVTRSGTTAEPVTAPWATTAGLVAPRASAGTDYVAASGSVTLPAGQSDATVTVVVRGQVQFEPIEHAGLALWPTSPLVLGDPRGDLRIVDND